MGASPPVTRPLISVAEASPANKRLQAASVASVSSRTVFRESTLTLPHETHLPLALRSGMDRSQMAEERVWGTQSLTIGQQLCLATTEQSGNFGQKCWRRNRRLQDCWREQAEP